MNKINDLSYGILLVLVIFVIVVFFHSVPDEHSVLDSLDDDKYHIINRSELKYYLSQSIHENCVKRHTLTKKIKTGLVRGLLMGVILNDLEGGMVLALLMGILNPVMHSLEVAM